MSRKVLIIGGTRFFGKRLALHCSSSGYETTIITRNKPEGPFSRQIEHLKADRSVEGQMQRAIGNRAWDIVWDQVCYTSAEAWAATRLFEGRAGKYIFTSTQSVYPKDGEAREADFDPKTHPLKIDSNTADYQAGKQNAEAAFAQESKAPVTTVRFPFVLGPDDYTGRFQFHADRIVNGRPLVIPNLNARMSVISSEEAAMFLFWAGHQNFDGPVNACSPQPVSFLDLIHRFEEASKCKANVVPEGSSADRSPYGMATSHTMNVDRAIKLGFQFAALSEWLPDLVRESVEKARR